METDTGYKKVRVFLRVVCAMVVLFYLTYGSWQKWTTGDVNLDTMDISLISGAIAILIAVEAVRSYVKRKLEK